MLREKLVELLWGGRDEDSARHSLRQALTTLRKQVFADDEADLVTTGSTVLIPSTAIDGDVLRFGALVSARSTDALADAVKLYKGDFLDGFSLPEESFDEWLVLERQRFRAAAVSVCTQLVARSANEGSPGKIVDYCEKLLSLDPFDERIFRNLMLTLAEMGRSAEALSRYVAFSARLQHELGIEPDQMTKEVYVEILGGRTKAGATSQSKGYFDQSLVDAFRSLDAFVLYDEEDRFVLCNDKFRQLFESFRDLLQPGTSFETIIRKLVRRNLFPDAAGNDEQWIAERMARHRRAENTSDLLLTDGRWMFLTQRRIDTGGLVVIFTDITDRKQQEISLRTAQRRYVALVQVLSVGVAELDKEGRITFANDTAHRLLELQNGHLVGESIFDLIAPGCRKMIDEMLNGMQACPRELSIEFGRAGGSEKGLSTTWNSLYGETNRLTGFIVVMSDHPARQPASGASPRSGNRG